MLPKLEDFLTKKLRFDARYTLRGGFWLLFGHVFTLLSVLGTSYVFANYLDPQLYGNYRYLMSAAIILSLFSLSGLNSATTQAVAKGIAGFFPHAIKLSLRYGLITSAVSLIGAIYYFIQENILLSGGLVLIAIIQPLINSSGHIFPYFYGQQTFQTNTYYHAVKTAITTVSIVMATLLSENVIIIFLAYLLSNLAGNLVAFLPQYRRELQKKEELDPESVRYISYAKHTSLQNILIGIANQLDKILIFQFLGAKELAVYAFATALPDQYKGITKTINSLILPRFSKQSNEAIQTNLWYKSLLYFIFLLISVIIYYFIAPYIYNLLYPSYTESIHLSQLYALGVIFGFGSVPLTALRAKMHNKNLYHFQITTAIFQIITLIIFLSSYGLLGAVFAKIFYRAFLCVSSYYFYFTSSKNTIIQ